MALEAERRLAAIMFTDIVGYTALMARDEEAGRRARDRHEAVLRPLVERYHGKWIERTGDETLSSRAERVTDSAEIAAFGEAWTSQSVFRRDPRELDEVWLYRLAPRGL